MSCTLSAEAVRDEGAREAGARLGVTAGGIDGFTASLTNPHRGVADE